MDGGADSGSGKMLKVEIAGEGFLGLEFGVDSYSGRVILVNAAASTCSMVAPSPAARQVSSNHSIVSI